MTKQKPFYITTPIYYVNDVPHIGHAYTTLACDVLARYKRSRGHEVFFLTGTDEHGQKVEKAAHAKGETPLELADRVVKRFQALWDKLNISHTDFIRTSQERHKLAVQEIFRDGVDNSDVDVSKLYTQPEEVAYAYDELKKVSDNFTIAASFGNVHGVYKPGNVKLTPKILDNSQKYIEKKNGTETNPVDFVFHGGSGSSLEEIREAIGYGVIKMNIDTDLQFAFTEGIRDYMNEKIDYLRTQIGNPDGADKPNKKYYDPRGWLRKGEETFKARLIQAFKDLNCVDTL